MTRDLHCGKQSGVERRRAVVCLALIALLLYNPFLTILGSSRDVSVRHPLSYRATVASSELRRCTVEPAKPLLPELTAAIFCAVLVLRADKEVVVALPDDAAVPMLMAACDSVWFRPPPSA